MKLKALRPITNRDYFDHTLAPGEIFVAPDKLVSDYLRRGLARVYVPRPIRKVYETKPASYEVKVAEPLEDKQDGKRRGRRPKNET